MKMKLCIYKKPCIKLMIQGSILLESYRDFKKSYCTARALSVSTSNCPKGRPLSFWNLTNAFLVAVPIFPSALAEPTSYLMLINAY